ncbi:flagellar hook-basal body protein [Clostridiales bacterium oral taxon 876 str. F0540]|nr:flagellar hook-basal body protein [Clostridiales bacterium oral taxon 876 str. F0540]
MSAQQDKLDSISNNIANANTTGYKRVDVNFKDLVYENLNRTGYPVTTSGQNTSYNGTGIRTGQWTRDNSQGNLTETGKSTDIAIDGQGYFQVTLPEKNADGTYKTAYTRGGNFSLDSEGSLVDSNGNRLVVAFNENTTEEDRRLSEKNFTIDDKGRIFKSDGNNSKEIGKINIYNVISSDSMQSVGENLYTLVNNNVNGVDIPVERPFISQDANVMQGFSELSNVNIAKEMTDMIITQRAFELSSKSMKTADDMWGMTNNLRSK